MSGRKVFNGGSGPIFDVLAVAREKGPDFQVNRILFRSPAMIFHAVAKPQEQE